MTRRIVSVTPFFNETHILELRLGILEDIVDKFYTVEADKTFTYQDKPMLAKTVVHPKHEVIEITLPEEVEGWGRGSNWGRDYYQRDYKVDLSEYNDDDIVLITDLDEVPRPEMLEYLRDNFDPQYSYGFEMVVHQYYLNNQNIGEGMIDRARAYSVAQYRDPNFHPSLVRFNTYPDIVVPNGGWHWTYIGDADFIRNKIEAFAHNEFDNDNVKNGIEQRIENNTDTLGRALELRLVPIDTDFYPRYIRDNKEKYSKYIKEL
jgi:beta-1,4-mannosyl-glycoprotein beta-1,4-N-acetylglucosaminyltransferase